MTVQRQRTLSSAQQAVLGLDEEDNLECNMLCDTFWGMIHEHGDRRPTAKEDDAKVGWKPHKEEAVGQVMRGKYNLDKLDRFFGLWVEHGEWRRVDIVVVPPEQWGFALLGWTGSKQYNRYLRQYTRGHMAKRMKKAPLGFKGFALSNHGLTAIPEGNDPRWQDARLYPTEFPEHPHYGYWPLNERSIVEGLIELPRYLEANERNHG